MTEFVKQERSRMRHHGHLYNPGPGVRFVFQRHNKLRQFIVDPVSGSIMTLTKYNERQARRSGKR